MQKKYWYLDVAFHRLMHKYRENFMTAHTLEQKYEMMHPKGNYLWGIRKGSENVNPARPYWRDSWVKLNFSTGNDPLIFFPLTLIHYYTVVVVCTCYYLYGKLDRRFDMDFDYKLGFHWLKGTYALWLQITPHEHALVSLATLQGLRVWHPRLVQAL